MATLKDNVNSVRAGLLHNIELVGKQARSIATAKAIESVRLRKSDPVESEKRAEEAEDAMDAVDWFAKLAQIANTDPFQEASAPAPAPQGE